MGTYEKGSLNVHRISALRERHFIVGEGGFWDLLDDKTVDPLFVMKQKGRSLTTDDLDELREMQRRVRAERDADDAVAQKMQNEHEIRYDNDNKKRKLEMLEAQVGIYKIWQTVNGGYNTYSGAMVVATSEEEARLIHPNDSRSRGWWCRWHTHDSLLEQWDGCYANRDGKPMPAWFVDDSEWCSPLYVAATWISSFDGDDSLRGTVLCSSYRAG